MFWLLWLYFILPFQFVVFNKILQQRNCSNELEPLLNFVSDRGKRVVLILKENQISMEHITLNFDVGPCNLHKYKENLGEHNHHYEKVSAKHLQETFELINILVRRKYVEAPQAFHIEYGLYITFILALFEGQTFFSRRYTAVSLGSIDFCNSGKCYFATVSLDDPLPHSGFSNPPSIIIVVVELNPVWRSY